MLEITDADRQAAQTLRVILADICGFWHPIGDESPLCVALARHRIEAEKRMVAKIVPLPAPRLPSRALTTRPVMPRPEAIEASI